jgi:hypothetical protein
MKVMKFLSTIIITACMAIAFASKGQTPPQPQGTNPVMPQSVSSPTAADPAMSQRLQSDFQSRNIDVGNQPVNWYNSMNGYYGTYSNNGQNFLTQYDKQGNFQQSYIQGNWNSNDVPTSLKSAYSNSPYKSQPVTGYWTSSDSTRLGYYLETKNPKGQPTGLWADENGTLSTTPPSVKKPPY